MIESRRMRNLQSLSKYNTENLTSLDRLNQWENARQRLALNSTSVKTS